MVCPICGLELPGHARFCARCGNRLPPGLSPRPAAGLRLGAIVLLCLGATLAGLVAAGYAVIFVAPELTAGGGSRLDPAQVRITSGVLAAVGAVLAALQLGALIGLARGREWGRVLATLAAAGWALTCIGLPLAGLLLHLVWRRPSRSGASSG